MLVLLLVLIFVYSTGVAIYNVQGMEPIPAFEFLFRAALPCGVVWWLRAEVKKSAATSLYCQGLLAAIGWIIIIPYHLIKTRGAIGLIPLLALIGSLVVSQIVAAVVYVIVSGQF